MNILAWNYQDTTKLSFVNYIKNLVRQYKPYICCFLEIRLSEEAIDRIQRLMCPAWDVCLLPAREFFSGIVVI